MAVIGHVPTSLTFEDAALPSTQHLMGVPLPANLGKDHIVNRISDWQFVDNARMQEVVQAAVKGNFVNVPTLVSTKQLLRLNHSDLDYESSLASWREARLMPWFYSREVWHPQHGMLIYRNISQERFKLLAEASEKKAKLVKMLWDANNEGVQIGTDTQQPFCSPGLSLQQEMFLFSNDAGIPWNGVFDIVTRQAGNAWQGLQRQGMKIGVIEEGALADFLIFRRDPTVNPPQEDVGPLLSKMTLTELYGLEAVVSRGRLYRIGDLKSKVEEWRAHFDDYLFDKVSTLAARAVVAQTMKRNY